MFSNFFIKRPIFAAVISVLIVIVGVLGYLKSPIEQYPNITPPQIQVTASFPGATAQTVADTVAAPLEDQINGAENMIYMYSESSDTGNLTLNVFFEIGSDPNQALNNVQDRVDQALSLLPPSVQKQGVVVNKQTPTILLIASIQSPNGRYDETFTSNYATINVVDTLLRVKGVSNATIINARNYAMRIWLKADIMAQLGITTTDVIESVNNQNKDYGVGELGQAPTKEPVLMTIPVTTLGRLNDPKQFEEIILRATEEGATVRLKDVAKVELGAQDYTVIGELNGKPSTLIAIYQDYGSNALDVADEVKKTLKDLSRRFPPDLTYTIPYDTTTFIKLSIEEVEKTLYEAAILVALVVLIFLQSFRATLIPVIAMTVSIIGTFAGMHLLGFSLNTLTLFGLVLAVGIVVDDAIVVVENVERNMRENNVPSLEAAQLAMKEVSGPIVAIVFVLCAVFIPVAFLGGIAGELYKQFAITIAVSVVISGIVALTLSPVLAALLFKKHSKPPKIAVYFNRGMDRLTGTYLKGAGHLVKNPWPALVFFIIVVAFVLFFFKTIPTSLVPEEDQGYIFAFTNMQDGSSLDRNESVTKEVEPLVKKTAGVKDFISITGFSLLENLNRTTVSTYFITLKDWNERKSTSLKAEGILTTLMKKFRKIPDGLVMAFNPPAIQGLGTVGGFEFWITNQGDASNEELQNMTQKFIAEAKNYPQLGPMTSPIQADCMQITADLDRVKAKAYKLPIGDVYETLQAFLGSVYVNNFNKYGRVFQVTVQAEPQFRSTLDDIGNIYVRSTDSEMIPIKSVVNFTYSTGANLVSRFNGFPAARVNGAPAEGYSSGEAMKAIEEIASKILPIDMTFSWDGEAYQEKATGGTSTAALGFALVLVFLILSALYERWSLPIAIILAVPFGVLGALIAIWLRGLQNDVYFQIGLVTLIALAAKNAILIVEFAMQKKKEGLTTKEAAMTAAKLRFRAIIMTSLTFIFGVLPLVISSGAGAASRHSVGTGVMGGMIVATFFGVFFVPLFYVLLDRDKKK